MQCMKRSRKRGQTKTWTSNKHAQKSHTEETTENQYCKEQQFNIFHDFIIIVKLD